MSYVSPNCPLPTNSADPQSACSVAYTLQSVNNMEQAVANGQAAVLQIAPPASFVQFGLPVAKQALDAQKRLATANAPGLVAGTGSVVPGARPVSQVAATPQVVPLNVTPAEYYGCCVRGVDPLPAVPVQTRPARIAIQPAPIPMQTAAGVIYLKPSQGAAPFMPHFRRSGGGVSPVQHDRPVQRFMGYSGYRGLGAAWGNAGTGPCGPTWGQPSKTGAWVWAVALVGLGVFALGHKR
jgi:hypothetical protein